MNWREVQYRWQDQKIVLKSYWQRLTNEDLVAIDGDRGGLARVLERRYDLAKGGAEKVIAGFEKDVRFPGAVK